jgi:hypothetical protein
MLAAMTSPTMSTPNPLDALPVPTTAPEVGVSWLPGADVATLLQRLDVGLQVRVSEPGKIVSVYRTSPDVTTAVTELARTGRRAVPQLDWTLEFSPAETVLILTGPESALAAIGLAEEIREQATGA